MGTSFYFREKREMRAIITVVGTDKVGIIASVTMFLAAKNINVIDINQTILSGNFVMMMLVSLDNAGIEMKELRSELVTESEKLGVEITVMNERVFSAMHRI